MGEAGRPTLAEYLELPYHVEVRGEPGEGGQAKWKATVEELPGCVSLAHTPDEAVRQLRSAMESWFTAALADQREIPVPSEDAASPRSARSHSGRFLVRMPRPLHQQLALAAEREHVSLNRFITDRLAASLAESQPSAAPPPASATDSGGAPPGDAPAPVPTLALTTTEASAAPRAFRLALATNLAVVLIVGLMALALLVIALVHGI